MGLHAVSQFIRTKYPHLLKKDHISLFAHDRVFLDIAGYLFKYVCACGKEQDRWLNALMNLMLTFRRNAVHVIPVFDGQAPAAKADEQKDRRDKRQKSKDRMSELKEALHNYRNNQLDRTTLEVLQYEVNLLKLREATTTSTCTEEQGFVLSSHDAAKLDELIDNLQRQTSYTSTEDLQLVQQLFTACGITWLQAPEESEAYCCYLVRQGLGTAVVSYDTDCIAHRADIVIFDVDMKGNITFLNLQEVYDNWKLNEQSIVDFGILCGCDYNPGSRVNKIGPVTAVKLLSKHECIENIPTIVDMSSLKHELCRQMFNPSYDITALLVQQTIPNRDMMQSLVSSRPHINQDILNKLIELNEQPKCTVVLQ